MQLTEPASRTSSRCELRPMNRAEWEAACTGFADFNYRQCWEYGQALARRHGAVSEHVGLFDSGELVGLADVRIKRLPLLGGIAYVSGGPLFRRRGMESAEPLDAVLDALCREFVTRRDLVLRISGVPQSASIAARVEETFVRHGFVPSDQAARYRTFVLDISGPLPELRSGLAQKWRNCLNKSERAGIKITRGDDASLFSRFVELFETFTVRKGIRTELDARFYADLQEKLPVGQRLSVALAEREGVTVAGHVSSLLGDTCVYLLGATSPEGLKCNAAYLLQWDTILAARDCGMAYYDLGGIDPDANPGVYHFKRGLGGTDVTAPGPFERAPASTRATLTLGLERLYRWSRGRRAGANETLKDTPTKDGGEARA